MQAQAIRDEYEAQGRYWFRNCLSERTLCLIDAAADLGEKPGERLPTDAGLREALSGDDGLNAMMNIFGEKLAMVRAVAFSKTNGANWALPWHQDRVIALAARHEMDGFTNWTSKRDVWHCEAPAAQLEQMFFVRVHLDENTADDGCMRIALGSHKLGPIPAGAAKSMAERFPQEDCAAKRGDVLVLKMLTLHASSSSLTENPRRVLRLDYAPDALLPAPLKWV